MKPRRHSTYTNSARRAPPALQAQSAGIKLASHQRTTKDQGCTTHTPTWPHRSTQHCKPHSVGVKLEQETQLSPWLGTVRHVIAQPGAQCAYQLSHTHQHCRPTSTGIKSLQQKPKAVATNPKAVNCTVHAGSKHHSLSCRQTLMGSPQQAPRALMACQNRTSQDNITRQP